LFILDVGSGKLKQGADDLVCMHTAGTFDQKRVAAGQKGFQLRYGLIVIVKNAAVDPGPDGAGALGDAFRLWTDGE
jgi:hypothetical protein